jgi:hypothetical protein
MSNTTVGLIFLFVGIVVGIHFSTAHHTGALAP